MTQINSPEAALAEILSAFPCPQCGTVQVLHDSPIPGATCDCGKKEGCQERWELGDIWSNMSEAQRAAAEAAESEIQSK